MRTFEHEHSEEGATDHTHTFRRGRPPPSTLRIEILCVSPSQPRSVSQFREVLGRDVAFESALVTYEKKGYMRTYKDGRPPP